MGGLQPWHWLIVIVFLLVVVGVVVGVVLVIVRASQPKTPRAVGGTAPGWYPDPHDPPALRYFDGRDWVTGKQPPPG